MKYKIIKTEGCTAFGITVNGKNLYGEYDPMTKEEVEELFDYLLIKMKEEFKDGGVRIDDFLNLLCPDEQHHDDEPCETCGDYVSEYTYNI